nr:class B sortase [Clostridioides difficile]
MLINIICIIALTFSSLSIYIKLSEYKKADEVYTELRENTINNSKHQELYDKNNDYRFWLKINNVNINYPVVQGYNNDFYLTHDFYKNYLPLGSIFMDYRNNFENDKSLIVYGHYMKNKTMFNNLNKFKDADFFKKNNKIKITLNGKEFLYDVFSAYIVESDYDYLKTNFNNESDYQNYINDITSKSLYKSPIKVNSNDKIVTLSTCTYEFDDARMVIHGRLI